jgi:hypothetical protein
MVQERVGSASVLGSLTKKVRLPDHASIFSAELHAIILSLEFVYASEKSNFVVCTDSLSSLQAIEGAKFENPFVVEILNLYLQLINRGKHIIMCWIPSHIGIRGNDMADKAAKEALELPISDIKIPYTDLYGNVKAFFQNEWQTFWNEQVNNKLHYVHPIIKTRQISRQLKHRRDEIIINRIKIGHTYMTHKYLLSGDDQPFCVSCDTYETVEHLLIHCVEFNDIRERFYEVDHLQDLFCNVDENVIIAFINEAGLQYIL